MDSINKNITLSTCAFDNEVQNVNTYTKNFEMAMAAGFAGFEIAITKEEYIPFILEAIHKTSAPIVAVHGAIRGNWLSNIPEEQEKAATLSAAYLSNFKEFAPCPIIEHYLDRYEDKSKGINFHKVMELLLEKTQKDNFIFCMENAPYKPEHDQRYPTVKEIASFVQSFGSNKMFITYDLNHANLNEDPVKACFDCQNLIKHIHISDNHNLREEHLIPGTGLIDFNAIFSALVKCGYQGPWNLEFVFPKGETPTQEKYRKIHQYIQCQLEKINLNNI
jgi:sugar phosphate isomerase/epimerase